MKKVVQNFGLWISLLAFGILFAGCFKDKLTKTYKIFIPVYKTKAEVLAGIRSDVPISMSAPGKIYLYGKYIFVNEINKGVHIINNSDPSNPARVSFIPIPGNIDIAVKGNILYADLYTDLVAIDISDPMQAKVVKTVKNIFPERQYYNFVPDTSLMIVDWIEKDTTVDVAQNPGWNGCLTCFVAVSADHASSAKGAFVPGVGGSLARFAVVFDHLYAVNNNSLNVVSIENLWDPVFLNRVPVGWGIETIYPFKDKLFIGSTNGMSIFSISDPTRPNFQGNFSHVTACDPVVADDKYAFVTLRAGAACEGRNNQLDVINVENVTSPRLIKTYEMSNPHGLSLDNDLLFLCDGAAGLKIFDVSNVMNIKLLKHIKGLETYDVIAWNKRLLVISKQGLVQFDYSNLENIRILSTMPINK